MEQLSSGNSAIPSEIEAAHEILARLALLLDIIGGVPEETDVTPTMAERFD
jgi:hypothetical protein